MAQGGSGVIPLGGYKLRFYLRLTMPDEISIPGLLKRLLWIENRRCNGISVTTLAFFVTSCHHENDWHVFQNYVFKKDLAHKLSKSVTYLLNEQIQDVFTFHFFENKLYHR